jgi:hypothetical protein
MSLLPDKLKLQAWRGATFRVTMTLFEEEEDGPVRDLTGYSGVLEVRERATGDILLTLDTDEGGIQIDEEEGQITLFVSKDDIEDLDWKNGIYDLTITAPEGDTDALFWGAFVIKGIR